MAAERVKPCLLDRIVDDGPVATNEQRAYRAITPQRYVKAVLRDLHWLFNTGAHPAHMRLTAGRLSATSGQVKRFANRAADEDDSTEPTLGEFKEAYNSVLAFGIPDLSGLVSSTLDLAELQEALEAAIKLFEPRIDPKSLRVRAVVHADAESSRLEPSVISFEIEGELWMEPVPEHLRIKTMLDLETGQCSLSKQIDG